MKTLLVLLMVISSPLFSQEQTPANGEEEWNMAVLGAGIGSPAGVSFIGGYYFNRLALRISGAGWGEHLYGVQADCSVVLNRGSFFSQGISLFAGRFSTESFDETTASNIVRRQEYAGVGYDLFAGGFYIEAGLGFGISRAPEYRNPIPVYQAGYLFHF